MSYTIRNTVILCFIALIVGFAGTGIVSYRYRNTVNTVKDRFIQQKKELETIRESNRYYENAEKALLCAQNEWHSMPKRLYFNEEENSIVSFAYFNTIASEQDSKIQYNFRNENIEPVKSRQIAVNTYTLSGTASFSQLYRFIWKLEQNPYLYTIEELEIQPGEDNESPGNIFSHAVMFFIVIRGYSAALPELEEQRNVKRIIPDTVRMNPFLPLIAKTIPLNTEDLFETDKAVLVGLSPYTAYIRNSAGRIWELHPGDSVYLGTLERIDSAQRAVVFLLNKGGIIERKTVKLEFSADNKGK